MPYEKLSPAQQKTLDDSPSPYFIPWDVSFKETSISTPARPTFDASSRSPSGYSLNDCLAKGDSELADLYVMVMNWMVGSSAVTGDISQFYNTVMLEEKHWAYQQVYWYDDLDPSSPLRRGVVVTLIYGVRCVKGQTETTMDLVAEPHKETFPSVFDLISKLRYVDDFGKGNKTDAESRPLKVVILTQNTTFQF